MSKMPFFESLELLPTDAVLEKVRNEFISDTDLRKVDLGAGIYRDEKGGDYVLPVVEKVRLPFQPFLNMLTIIVGLSTSG